MKICVLASVFIGLFFTSISSTIFADDYPEATAAILNEIIRKEIDSNQIEIGPSLFYNNQYMEPAFHINSKIFFNQRYTLGGAVNIHIHSKDNRDFIGYGGLNIGVRGYHRKVGKYYFQTLVGYGKANTLERFIIEPSIVFPLTESGPVRYFWLRHKFGVSAAIAYRHAIDPDNVADLDDLNVIKVYLNFYMNQKSIN